MSNGRDPGENICKKINQPVREKKTFATKKLFDDTAPQEKKKKCGGRRHGALSYELKKSQSWFLHDTCCWTAQNQAQRVEQQRRHRRASVNESHVCSGPLGLAIGSTRMLPPRRRVSCTDQVAGYVVLVCCCWARVNNKNVPTNSHRQSATYYYTALRRNRLFDGAARTFVEARPTPINSSRASCSCACSWA